MIPKILPAGPTYSEKGHKKRGAEQGKARIKGENSNQRKGRNTSERRREGKKTKYPYPQRKNM